jgi:hypothetical protein
MDAVVLAAPAIDDHTAIEVMWFEVAELLRRFDEELQRRRARGQDVAPKIPIFLPIRGRGGGKRRSLVEAAVWTERIAATGVPDRAQRASLAAFIERVEHELSELLGIDRRQLLVEIRITSKSLATSETQQPASAECVSSDPQLRKHRKSPS